MGDLIVAYPHGVWSTPHLEREGCSGTGEPVLRETGSPLFVPPVSTIHGTPVDQAISALRSCVRKADLKFALYWTAQLDMIGLARAVWYTLIMMMFSDVGVAYPSASLMAFELYQLWKHALQDIDQQQKDGVLDGPFAPFQSAHCPEARRIIMSMTTMACALPKSRLVSHADSAQLLHHQCKLNAEDWTVKIGSNRKLSATIRPLRDSHTLAVSKAITCLSQYIIHQYEPGMLRVADLLMEWGHTALIWDVVDKVCSHVENLTWAKYYHHRYARIWYWATGKGVDQPDILFETAVSSVFGEKEEEHDGYSHIPIEWKARHDQSRAFVIARTIPIQCLLLIVRSNPGILEGITPERCTQYDKTVDEYYSPMGKMNKPFEVPDEAKTLFTTEGHLHGRGFDMFWQDSERLARVVDTIDPYEQVVLEGYMNEEATHGTCGNDAIIMRRIAQPGYYEEGYDAENPLCKTSPPPLSLGEEEGGFEEEEEERVPRHLQRYQRRFRNPKPGPPKDMDAMAILGREFEEKALIRSSSSSSSPPSPFSGSGIGEREGEGRESGEEEGPAPPLFLAPCPASKCVRRKPYKLTPTAVTLDYVFTWRGKSFSSSPDENGGTESPKKRRRGSEKKSVEVCGPMTIDQATKAVMCNTVEQKLSGGVFPRKKVSIEPNDDQYYLLSKPSRRWSESDEMAKKQRIFRWCEGCASLADATAYMDTWIGLQTNVSVKETDVDTIPVIDSKDLLEWCRQVVDAVHTVELTERKRDRGSMQTLLLITLRTRLKYLIDQCVFL
jgi:hypothetical protein